MIIAIISIAVLAAVIVSCVVAVVAGVIGANLTMKTMPRTQRPVTF